jgi:hypothetical protein
MSDVRQQGHLPPPMDSEALRRAVDERLRATSSRFYDVALQHSVIGGRATFQSMSPESQTVRHSLSALMTSELGRAIAAAVTPDPTGPTPSFSLASALSAHPTEWQPGITHSALTSRLGSSNSLSELSNPYTRPPLASAVKRVRGALDEAATPLPDSPTHAVATRANPPSPRTISPTPALPVSALSATTPPAHPSVLPQQLTVLPGHNEALPKSARQAD